MHEVNLRIIKLPKVLGLLALVVVLLPAYGGEKVTYFHWDAQGSPIAATDEQGNVIWREEYHPFGARIRQEPAAAHNTRWYTGHPHDDDTGLTYMGARYYDPLVGRFMAVDPKEFHELDHGNVPGHRVIHSFNRYGYAANNPYKYVDPDGRAWLPLILQGARAVLTKLLTRAGLRAAPNAAKQAAQRQAQRTLGQSGREGVPKGVPEASNPRLQRAVRELFREGDRIPGGTAGAIRHELRTGELVGGKSHIIKGQQRARQLDKILRQEKLSDADRATAQRILQDLRDALAGK